MSTELPPLPEPYGWVIAYTGKYATGGYCAEIQATTVRNTQEKLWTAEQMQAYARAAVEAEREACARACDVTPPYPFRPSIEAAHAIRQRGKQ